MELRSYQRAALAAVYDHLRTRDDNPCVVIPTGGGKTPIIAQLCSDVVSKWRGRVLVLSHVKELLEQSARHLASFLPMNMVGLNSAGLGQRDTTQPVIVAGIQSVYDNAGGLGPFNIIVIDESHLIPESGEGRYLTFLRDARIVNPGVRLVGLTATPYRLGSGLICKPENMLNNVCYDANVRELIVQGWLCTLTTKRGAACADLSDVRIASTGDFAADEMQEAFDSVVKPACEEVLALCANRHSVLVFAAGVKHAAMISTALGGVVVDGKTSKSERALAVEEFRAGRIKYLVNVGVFTTGFDAPNVDAVVLLRATMSPGLYSQIVGRGLRKHASKTDCLVLDYGDNALRHGPIDRIVPPRERRRRSADSPPPGKECPNCHEVIASQYHVCPVCEYEFPAEFNPHHHLRAGDEPILSEPAEPETFVPVDVKYSEHVKHKEGGVSVTLRVQYVIGSFSGRSVSEFICFNHPRGGYARRMAENWWRVRTSAPMPDTVMDALALIAQGALGKVNSITIVERPGSKYEEIVGVDFEVVDREWPDETDDEFFAAAPEPELEDIPF